MTGGTLVIVGASLAGAKAAEAARATGFDGRVVLVGDEHELPYERPPLSKAVLRGEAAPETTRVHDEGFYASQRHRAADRPHGRSPRPGHPPGPPRRRRDRAVLRRGPGDRRRAAAPRHPRRRPRRSPLPPRARRRPPPRRRRPRRRPRRGDRRRVDRLGGRGLRPADGRRGRPRRPRPGAAPTGPRSTRSARCSAACTPTTASSSGSGPGSSSCAAASRVEQVVLDDGDVEAADVVVVGVGVTPRVELADAAGLTVDNGIVVDEHLRSSDPGVYAAGDVASAWHPHYRRHLRVEHWANALNQGTTAGANAAGGTETYTRLPYFFSDQYDLGMEYVGDSRPDDTVVIRGDLGGAGVHRLLAARRRRHRRHERQRLGRRRRPQGDRGQRASARDRTPRRPLTPPRPARQPGSGVSQGIWAETQWVICSS